MGNRGKLILVAVLMLVAGGIWWIWGREPAVLPDSVTYVDVETGERYQFAQDQLPGALPARSPKSGKATLMPCSWNDGKLFVRERYARILRDDLREVNKHVDPTTLEVR